MLAAFWFAELSDPRTPITSPPAIVTGALPLIAFWFALAFGYASCSVAAFWSTAWNWPEPPQP